MTVQHWINQPSYRWKTFVANRVSEIQQISKDESVVWHHCPGQDNPADIVSRGATVKELKDSMWLHGPQWLTRTDLAPVERLTSTGTVEEVRVQAVLATPDEQKWWTRLSRWTRVVGMVARISVVEVLPRNEAQDSPASRADYFQDYPTRMLSPGANKLDG